MSYQAIISRIIQTRPIEGADRIVAATVSGSGAEVVVSVNNTINELGVYFPEDGIFEDEFCEKNNLFPIIDTNTGKRVGGGFFDRNNPRIRAQKFKRVKSNGFWCPLSYLEYTGYDLSTLKEGDKFTELNGKLICQKYYTQATLRALNNAKKQGVKQPQTIAFPQHVDSVKFEYSLRDIKKGDIITLSTKMHGTSARFGKTFINKELAWWKKIVNKIVSGFYTPETQLDYLVGTRRVILGHNKGTSYYGDESFRYKHLDMVKSLLQPGEIIMGELVGYSSNGSKIMSDHFTKETQDKEFIKQYGETISYTYGCPPGECEFYVYRILKCDQEGNSVDLTWPQVKNRCFVLGLKTVQEIIPSFVFDGNYEALDELVKSFENGPDPIDPRIHKEGVVVRVDNNKTIPLFLKKKNWYFGVMEGYIKNNDNYVDLEEAS